MNRFESISRPLQWFMALLLVAFVAGCSSSSSSSSAADTTAPIVSLTSPADGATAAASSVTAVTATFNEAMKSATFTTTTFTVQVSGVPVTGTVAYDSPSKVVTFTPASSPLAAGTYTATVAAGATDLAGNALVVPASGVGAIPNPWTFTVAAAPPVAINLGSITTNNFVILATSQITEATPASGAITGNIGLSPATGAGIFVACSEMLGGGQIHDADGAYAVAGFATCAVPTSSVVGQAVLDMGAAYTAASAPATPAAIDAAHLNVLSGIIPAGTIFAPGTYTWDTPGDVSINGNITLTGSATDVWIFQMSGNLTTAAGGAPAGGAQVIVSGGALASNVFWRVGGASVTLGTYSTFTGNILTSPSTLIAIQTGAVLHGRALSGTSVALDGNIVGP